MGKKNIARGSVSVIIAMILLIVVCGCTGERSEPVTEEDRAVEDSGRPASSTESAPSEMQADEDGGEEQEEEEEVEEEADAEAASTGSITGVIYMDDTPLGMGTIQVENSSHRIITRVRSDTRGRYSVGNLAPGTYTLRYIKSSGGAYGLGRRVSVRAGETTEYDIRLTSYE